MNASDFWKNFRLGEEIGISGAFIYDGLRRYHEMKALDFPDEVFAFLYDVSVGLERLLKIAVVLYEHQDADNHDNLEKSLITHNHLDLLARLRKYTPIKFGAPQIDLLGLLGTFYKTLRYDRFTLASVYDSKKEMRSICGFLAKHLNVKFPEETSVFSTTNEDRYRKFIQRTIVKISKVIYSLIETRARAINLYTYEVRSGSKAETVFLREVEFISNEEVLWKELLIFFMNTDASSPYLKFLKGVSPLDFDPCSVRDYLDCFQSDASKSYVMDELEHLYEQLDSDKGERLELIGVIGAPNIYFPEENEEKSSEDTELRAGHLSTQLR